MPGSPLLWNRLKEGGRTLGPAALPLCTTCFLGTKFPLLGNVPTILPTVHAYRLIRHLRENLLPNPASRTFPGIAKLANPPNPVYFLSRVMHLIAESALWNPFRTSSIPTASSCNSGTTART